MKIPFLVVVGLLARATGTPLLPDAERDVTVIERRADPTYLGATFFHESSCISWPNPLLRVGLEGFGCNGTCQVISSNGTATMSVYLEMEVFYRGDARPVAELYYTQDCTGHSDKVTIPGSQVYANCGNIKDDHPGWFSVDLRFDC